MKKKNNRRKTRKVGIFITDKSKRKKSEPANVSLW